MSETTLFIGLTKPKETTKTLRLQCPTTGETVLIRTINDTFLRCCFDNQTTPCKQCKLKPENNKQQPKRKRPYQSNFSKTTEQLTQKLTLTNFIRGETT